MSDASTARHRGPSTKRPSGARRAVAIILPLMIIGAAVGFFAASSGPATWQASEPALIQVWSIDSQVLGGAASDLTSQDQADAATIATSQEVLQRAVAGLKEPGLTADELRKDVTATASTTSHFVVLQATGSSAAQAEQRAQVVANMFVAVAKEKVLASATRLASLPPAALGSTTTAQEIRLRAIAVAQTVQPVQLYPAGDPVKSGTSTSTGVAAGGIIGLAVGALIIVSMSFAAPRLRTATDGARRLGLPSLDWNTGLDPGPPAGLLADLCQVAGRGLVAVCPVSVADVAAAQELERWLSYPADQPLRGAADDALAARVLPATESKEPWLAVRPLDHGNLRRTRPVVAGRGRGDARNGVLTAEHNGSYFVNTGDSGVVLVSAPDAGLAAARPAPDSVDTLVLVAAVGTSIAEVEQAVASLSSWRSVDALVVASKGR